MKSGQIEQRGALEEEYYDEELSELPRIVFRHRRRDFGRLRVFVNALNQAEVES